MAGVSLSFLAVDDATLARIDAPTEAPAWPRVAPFSVAAHRPEARPPHLAQPAAADALAPPRPLGPVGLLLARCIGKVCGAALEATESLNALDAAVGDGDMGMNIRNGAEAVMRSLPGPDGHPRERRASDAEAKPPGRSASPARRPSVSAVAPLPADDPVKCMAHVAGLLRHSVGGTSGPLYAVFFLRLSSALAAAQQRGASALDPHAWAEAFRAGVEGVMALGGASAGDRTAVDALLPAAAALQDAIARKEGGGAALAAAAAAAEAGAEKTKGMVPRRGRASYVGARAAGHADPGAVAAGVLLRALAGAVESHGQTETSRFLSPGML
eukprot:tig00020563_g11193.t1